MTARNWCFTLNNWTLDELDAIQHNEKIKYAVIGKEFGENGTPHLQGYFMAKHPLRFAAVKKILGHRAHFEKAVKGLSENFIYCTKQGDYIEVGQRPMTQEEKGQTEIQRYERAWTLAREGKIEEIDARIRFRFYGTIRRIHHDAMMETPLSDTEEQMYWFYGPTGTGKSRKARSDYPDAYLKMANKWWDGYNQEETVLIEDWDKKHDVLVYHLKIWADRYPFPAEIKGGKINIRPKRIIVTSNYHPREIWSDPRDLEPILRRFHVIHFQNSI